MLSDQEFKGICIRTKLPGIGIEKLKTIRASGPVRRVWSGKGNRIGTIVSRKMKCTIQYESANVELPFIVEYDYDDDVLEIYDQPCSFKVNPLSRDGKRRLGYFITPDLLVIRQSSVAFEELRQREAMEKLIRERPNTYIYDEEKKIFRFPEAERYAEQYGFEYRIRVSSEINWNVIQNIIFLADYFNYEYQVHDSVRAAILSVVSGNQGISIANILSLDGISADDIYAMIARRDIYVDLESCLVNDSEYAHCFSDQVMAKAYSASRTISAEDTLSLNSLPLESNARFLWDGVPWTIMNAGLSEISVVNDNGEYLPSIVKEKFIELVLSGKITGLSVAADERLQEGQRIILSAGQRALEAALKRQEILDLYKSGCRDLPVTERTIRNWKRNCDIAEIQYGNGFAGLIDNHCLSGNRNREKYRDLDAFTGQFIAENYENVRNIEKSAAYVLYQKACIENGLTPFSEPTFKKKIEERDKYNSVLQREGKRAAYQFEELKKGFKPAEKNMLKHATRPWQIAYIDHYEFPTQLVYSKNMTKKMGKVWLSALIDDFDRRVLACYISFDRPSYRSNMEIIRECVRRHGRVPDAIVSDNGAEFDSFYYLALLAFLGVRREKRPPNEPKYGALIERLFGTVQTQFAHNLMGNTKIMNKYRQVTKTVDPKNLACWTFGRLLFYVQEYLYVIYETEVHSALGMTPREKNEEGIRTTGNREFRLFPYDENFIIMTMPGPTRQKGQRYTAMVRINGVKINNRWYRCEQFKKLMGQRVQVRYDPWNSGVAYARIVDKFGHGTWVRCLSEYYSVFKNRTEKELKIAAVECRREQKLAGKRKTELNGKILADFLTRAHAEESELMKQRRRDEESSGLRLVYDSSEAETPQAVEDKNNNVIQFKAAKKLFDKSKLQESEEF